MFHEGIARPLLLGNRDEIEGVAEKLQMSLEGVDILNPLQNEYFDGFLEKLFAVLQRNTDMENVVNVIVITVAQAQSRKQVMPS